MADSTQKPDKRDSRVGEPISGTYENPGSRPTIGPTMDVVRESKPDRAWPIPHERPSRESMSAPRPSHLPAPEWTLDAAIRAASELEADLREKADEPEIARTFVDALRQVLPGVEVTVRVFSGTHVAWFVASAELAEREGKSSQRVTISRAALSRARTLAAVLGNLGAPPLAAGVPGAAASDSGVTVPAVRISEDAQPIVKGMEHAVDALATEEGQPVAIVTVESADASRVRSLEPLVALFGEKLGSAIGRLRASQNEEFLRRYLQDMFEHARGPIIAIAPDRTVRAVNRPALALIEQPLDRVIGQDLVAILRSDEHRERVAESFGAVLGGQSSASFELRVNKKDGTTARTRWNTATIHDVDGTVGAIVAMGEDLSDVQRLEQQIIHAEKLATLGQLAAGVLHELNNPLTSITVYSEYLLGKHKRAGAEPGDVEKLGRIVESAARMTKFTRDLVTYARPTTESATKVSMIEVLEQSLGFCEHVLDEAGVLVERSYAQDLSPVEAVRGQLHQIFVNLITNASQAMANDPRRTAMDAPRSKLSVSIDGKGDRVIVRISDNGPGIPPENVARVFDPFFTTKGEGKGTGLGLSIVRNLVEQHGGSISVESRTESRTTSSGSAHAPHSAHVPSSHAPSSHVPGQSHPPPASGTTGTSFELRFVVS